MNRLSTGLRGLMLLLSILVSGSASAQQPKPPTVDQVVRVAMARYANLAANGRIELLTATLYKRGAKPPFGLHYEGPENLAEMDYWMVELTIAFPQSATPVQTVFLIVDAVSGKSLT